MGISILKNKEILTCGFESLHSFLLWKISGANSLMCIYVLYWMIILPENDYITIVLSYINTFYIV